jgi:hypothetical protein
MVDLPYAFPKKSLNLGKVDRGVAAMIYRGSAVLAVEISKLMLLNGSLSAFEQIVFSNSGSGCQALYDHPCRAHFSPR